MTCSDPNEAVGNDVNLWNSGQTTIVEWALKRWPLTVSSGGDFGESAMSDADLESLGADSDD